MFQPRHLDIRLVKEWDSRQIVMLYRAGGWWKEGYNERGIPDLISGSFLFAVAVDTTLNKAVGMGRVISDGISDGYIQDLVVLPEYRKCGIGNRIVSELLGACKQRGLGWIGLISQPGCEQFYEKLGFKKMEGFVPLLYEQDSQHDFS
ncbi:MAG: Acetyltransferase (GNAT) family protein [Methanoregula sp. PtaU1.Bin051]|nr:MAG: Acetyltransferase (GNAT) family protein [Methanoregula sp. PtaU1.Bin051]